MIRPITNESKVQEDKFSLNNERLDVAKANPTNQIDIDDYSSLMLSNEIDLDVPCNKVAVMLQKNDGMNKFNFHSVRPSAKGLKPQTHNTFYNASFGLSREEIES